MDKWPLVGRDSELQLIESGSTSATVIAGAAGVGKTTLAAEALRRFEAAGRQTDWVIGTRAAASILFGAVVHLLPPRWRSTGESIDLMRSLSERAKELGGRDGFVLAVDDAHLLDDGSAAVIAHLARRRLAYLVITFREGNPVPDAIVSLWRDGYASRIDLPVLPEQAIDELLSLTLGGPMDGLSRRLMHRAAARNPLALRELLHSGLTSGALAEHYGVWRWLGSWKPPARVTELVADRVRDLDPALEVVACGEPLPLKLVERLTSMTAIAEAEREGLLTLDSQGVRMAHPLYGEAVRAGLPVARSVEIWRELAEAALDDPSVDPLRVALWQVEGGLIAHPEVVLAGAEEAVRRSDLALAEKLARAARDAAPSSRADRVLGEILEYRGSSVEAAEVLPEQPPAEGLTEWAVARASTLYWGLGRFHEAATVLDLASDQPDADLAESTLSWMLFFDGQCAAALNLARRLLARPGVSDQAALWATASGIAAAGFLGLHGESAAIRERGLRLALARQADLPWGMVQVGFATSFACLAAGDLVAGWRVVEQGYAAAVEAQAPMMVGGWSFFRGLTAAAQGRVGAAQTILREAVGALTGNDTYRTRRPSLAALAQVTAQSGDADAAEAWLSQADRQAGIWNGLFAPWLELGRAWTHASASRLSEARQTARNAAKVARTSDLPTLEVVALYDLARLGGRPDEQRLRDLALGMDACLPPVMLQASAALRRGDGDLLGKAGGRFAELGYPLLAAEAFSAAGKAYHTTGHRASAQLCAAKAATTRAECGAVVTPLLPEVDLTDSLTAREREVVLLAVTQSTRKIAQILELSPNTINNNLARAYAKLGVSGRAELRELLQPHSY